MKEENVLAERVTKMEWLKKLLKIFQEERIEEEKSIVDDTFVSKNINKEMQTKVTYHYPKGNFRFPIQLDSEKTTGELRRKRQREQQNIKGEKDIENESSRKKPYKFEDIPSPIYGFTRKQRKRQLLDVEEDSKPFENKTSINESNETIEFLGTEDPELLPMNEQRENETNVHHNEEEEESNDSLVHMEQEIEEEIRGETETTEEKKENTIPFNVLMLSSDKNKIKKENVPYQQNLKKDDQSNKPMQSYMFPPIHLLKPPVQQTIEKDWMYQQTKRLDETLKNFNVKARVVHATQGPSVTRFEISPEPGVKVNKITNLSDDLKLSLAAKDIRMEAPIPGKHTIGIEVPNHKRRPVFISEIINSQAFKQNTSPLTVVLGLDISGNPIVTDLKSMPHGLIAGATGSGKSVCINSMIISLLYKASPEELKLMLIDPKMVELAPYNDIPHLVSPVITDVKAATASLKWAVEEMERRYELFAKSGTRDIQKYNELVKRHHSGQHLPYIVIIIDELADLMMVAPGDVEEAICRIAQKARACGIHLILATQRPSVDVITGLIKANVPTRIAFSVSSQVDSRTIIDVGGAEKLLGKGDMLFLGNGVSKVQRLQGTFVTDEEIDAVVNHVRQQGKPNYLFKQEELLKKADYLEEEDDLFYEACEFVVSQKMASTSSLQRRFRIGYNRAARLIEMMEMQGIISESKGSKPREVLISEDELEILR